MLVVGSFADAWLEYLPSPDAVLSDDTSPRKAIFVGIYFFAPVGFFFAWGGVSSAFVLLRFLTSEHELSLSAICRCLLLFFSLLLLFCFSALLLLCFSDCLLLCLFAAHFNALLSCASALHLLVFCLFLLMILLLFILILVN